MKVLSFGAGVQTTALAILVAKGKVKTDVAIFADTGGERPETYWYLENYTKQIFKDAGVPFEIVRNELKSCQPDLYGWLYKHSQIPSISGIRLCSIKFKRETIERYMKPKIYQSQVGFSIDEIGRAKSHPENSYPLLELGLSVNDCQRIITDYGLPIPLKSSCFFCPFQTPYEWQWLKVSHPDLFQRTLELEAQYHKH